MRHLAIWMLAFGMSCLAAGPALSQTDARSVVSALSGRTALPSGFVLSDRYSVENRSRTRTYLAGLLEEVGLTPQRHSFRQDGENVFGKLPATTDSREIIVVGAHFDSVRRSPGANDNATGVAMALAAVHELGAMTCRTRSVIVAFFDLEEAGLLGSAAFARKLVAENTPVHSVHTVDQMGWDGDGDRAVELELPTAALLATYQRHGENLGITIEPTRTNSTNHDSFRRLGLSAVGLTEEYVNGDTTPHYHRSSDIFETVDFDYLDSSTRLFSAVLRELISEGC